MAKRRDIIIGVIIAVSALFALGLFALMMIGFMSGAQDYEMGGIGGGNIGLVEVNGEINETMGRQVIRQLERWVDNGSIKAIVVQINSPGGGVSISQEIYDAILRAKAKKPVVADMASVAASGGLYIAVAADKIVANPGTLTGSIGVIFQFHTFKNLMDKVGINTETIKSGELKDVGTYARPMTEKEHKMLQEVVTDTYEQFVMAVAEGRRIEAEEVRSFADGSVFTGRQALDIGLVDTLGGLHEAVQVAAGLAKLKGEPQLVRPIKRERISLFDLLGQFTGRFGGVVDRAMEGPQLMYLFQ